MMEMCNSIICNIKYNSIPVKTPDKPHIIYIPKTVKVLITIFPLNIVANHESIAVTLSVWAPSDTNNTWYECDN